VVGCRWTRIPYRTDSPSASSSGSGADAVGGAAEFGDDMTSAR
jgi:hypothetical protein